MSSYLASKTNEGYRRWLSGVVVAILMSSCAPAGRPGVRTAADRPAVAPPVKRDTSKDARAAFVAAREAYAEAAKGGLTADTCASAAEPFARAYADYPQLVEAKFNEGVAYQLCGDLAKAEAIYQQLLQSHPDFGPALNNLGQIAYARGQREAGIDYFRRAAKAKNSEGYANLAMVDRENALQGNVSVLREAVKNIYRALAVDSHNIEAYGMLATLVYDHAKARSELEMARLICMQAIEKDPDYAPVYNVFGLVLLRMQEVTRALKQFREAVARDVDFVEAHMNIGAITLSFRDYKAAETAFSKVLSLNPDKQTKFDATVGLGVAYRGQRRYTDAMAQYEAAGAIDPSASTIAYNKAILLQDYLFDAGNPEQAISQLQDARRLLRRFTSSAPRRSPAAVDARRRIKNIDEMIPMLREQQKMMQQAQQS